LEIQDTIREQSGEIAQNIGILMFIREGNSHRTEKHCVILDLAGILHALL